MEKDLQLLLEHNFTEDEALKTLETAHVIPRIYSDPRLDIGRYYTEIVQLEEYQEAYENATTGDEILAMWKILALWERIGTEVLNNNPFIYVGSDVIVNTF